MKPTIEEIKQKYANAKEVISTYDGEKYDISNWKKYFDNEDGSYWVEDLDNYKNQAELYDKGKYAEIISYKEETLPIPKSVLLQLAENNSLSESIIKKEFPQLFESELEVGKWYKLPSFDKFMCLFNGKYGNSVTYGFNKDGLFSDFLGIHKHQIKEFEPATEQEVFGALTNEAIKRGYENNHIKIIKGSQVGKKSNDKLVNGNFIYYKNSNELSYELLHTSYTVFRNGTWAEIIDQPKEITISEIESILGYKILIKE